MVVYTNTDQLETTRLGMEWEWRTDVLVKRENQFERSGNEVLDEIEIFKGDENSLSLVQSYTHEFQCVYQLEKYPFDTQVRKTLFDTNNETFSGVFNRHGRYKHGPNKGIPYT